MGNNMKYTLTQYLDDLSKENSEIKDLCSLWQTLKKDLSNKLSQIIHVFPHFSLHDESHSKALITNISLFLGEDRIKRLSPTDTFLLIFCSYIHDYGMAYDLEEICTILEDSDGELKKYIGNNKQYSKEAEILYYLYSKRSDNQEDNKAIALNLKSIYLSITVILEEFLRPTHADRVEKMYKDFEPILSGRIKNRFIIAIVYICKLHNYDFDDIFKNLEYRCKGIFSDECHPRFIASMIRLGDLLDIDNNRFSRDFEIAFLKEENSIPLTSRIHYLKHESIKHLYISEDVIEIVADINSKCDEENKFAVAKEISSWFDSIEQECYNVNAKWSEMVQSDFGTPARLTKRIIYIDNVEYTKQIHDLKMELPNDRIFSLLEGTNIYKNKFVAFREVIQNAIDATLLRVWKDFKLSNILENESNYERKLADYLKRNNNSHNDTYGIRVNIIWDREKDSVYVEVIDNGIGIGDHDLEYMSKIGGSHMSNPSLNKLLKDMPAWLMPSGAFGIGLQSLFQLTNQIDFYSKKINKTPRHIRFYSYSYNKGNIEYIKVPNANGHFTKVPAQGTMVRFKIEKDLFFKDNHLSIYDYEFDDYIDKSKVIAIDVKNKFIDELKRMNKNYFHVSIFDNISSENIFSKSKRKSSHLVSVDESLCDVLVTKNKFQENILKKIEKNKNHIDSEQDELIIEHNKPIIMRCYDKKNNLFFTIEIPNLKIATQDDEGLINEFLNIHYKYIKIDNYDSLFDNLLIKDEPYREMVVQNKNIMKVDIGVFDKNTPKYLSIDRNKLKENSLSYDMVKEAEKACFNLLCEKIIDYGKDIGLEYSRTLALFFTRFVSERNLSEFKEINKSVEKANYLINGNNYTLDELDKLKVVQYSKENFLLDSNDEKAPISLDDLYKQYPYNFFIPYEVSEKNNIIEYICKIRRENSNSFYVKMDENSKRMEVLNSIKSELTIVNDEDNKKYKIRDGKDYLSSLVRCVFKPWEDYKDIVVSKYPVSFKDKSHFTNILEKNIGSYILSPFDLKFTQLFIENKSKGKNECLKIVKNYFESSSQLEKCMNYVAKYGVLNTDIRYIKRTYIAFADKILGYLGDIFKFDKND